MGMLSSAVVRRIQTMDSRWVSISEGLLTSSLRLGRVREESLDSTCVAVKVLIFGEFSPVNFDMFIC